MPLEYKIIKPPKQLNRLPNPPKQLYVRGDAKLLNMPAVAVVGTRKISYEGRALTKQLAADLARAGLVIVSGLAFGADAAAHEGALEAGGLSAGRQGLTVAVLASGVMEITPREHENLGQKILKNGGAIVGEQPPESPAAFRGSFLERNRLVAGLCLAVVVTEAPIKSGALNTASHARKLGRPIFAVPGSPLAFNSQGANLLIQQGARLVTRAADILEILKFKPPAHSAWRNEAGTAHSPILNALKNGPQNIDNLASITKLAIVPLMAELTKLELDGQIKDIGNKNYVLCNDEFLISNF